MLNNIHEIGQAVALISFAIGTSLLSLFLYFGEDFIAFEFAFACIVIKLIVNSIVFIALLGYGVFNPSQRIQVLKTCFLMLLNIPIAILYMYMVITFPYYNIVI